MTFAQRSVLIIGQTGQLARSLDEALAALGYTAVVIGRPDIDLGEPGSLSRAVHAFRPKIVINAAAYTAVDRAEDEPEAAYAVNARGAEAAAKAAAEIEATIIHISTDYVFDGSKRTPYTETDVPRPLSVYGQTKRAGEDLVVTANPKHIILRTAWLFSPFGSNFAKTMLRLSGERPELSVVDDQHGTPTYAPDLANIICSMIVKLEGPSPSAEHFGTFHAVNGGETTWCGFARAIIDGAAERGAAHALIRPITTADYPAKAQRPAYSVLSTAKLARVYDLRMRPWTEALSDGLDRLIGSGDDVTLDHKTQDLGQTA